MRVVIFVAPFFLDTTLRFVEVTAELPGVAVGLIHQDPVEMLPPELARKLAANLRVVDALSAQHIADALGQLQKRMGKVDRLLGALEQLQVPLAEVREGLGIEGMGITTAENFREDRKSVV